MSNLTERTIILLSREERDRLEDLAHRKFGDNKSATVRWALSVADLLVEDPSAAVEIQPYRAMLAWARERKDKICHS